MSQLPIYSCFHSVLKKKTKPVSEIDGKLNKIVEDMFETMYKADGVGLAANQVGLDMSLVVIDISDREEGVIKAPLVLINPVIEVFSENKSDYKEGCLSIPELREWVERPSEIQIRYYDMNAKEIVAEYNDTFARVIQHETDHLNGIVFVDRLTPMRKALAQGKLKRIKKGDIDIDYEFIIK